MKEIDTRSIGGKEQLLRVSQYTGVTQRKREDGLNEPDTRAESLVGYKRVEPKDFVINIMLAWNGSMGVSRFPGIVSPAYCVYRFNSEFYPWYFHHLLRSPLYNARIKAISTGVIESRLRLYSHDLFRMEAIIPSLAEQKAIVRFLDWANEGLDRAILVKQKVISLLREQKQAIIHRAVTRGLDPTVPLKPSGIPWLGDIPMHWKVHQLRRLVLPGRRITYGIVQPGEPCKNGRYMVRGQDYSNGWGKPDTLFRVTPEIEEPYSRSRLKSGDLLITIVGAGVGNIAVVPEWLDGANITQTTARISVDSNIANPGYVALALQGPLGRNNVEQYVKGAAQPGLNLEHVRIFLLPMPPLEEQARIIKEMEPILLAFSTASAQLEGEIRLLREYSTRMTADVVTGKFDVREVAGGLTDKSFESVITVLDPEEPTHAFKPDFEEV